MRLFSRSPAAAAAATAACAAAPAGGASAWAAAPSPPASAPASAPSSATSSSPASVTGRTTGDTVPAAARVAVLTESRGLGGNATPPSAAEATVTSAQQVAALAGYLNGLSVTAPGAVTSCPNDSGGALTITFRATAGGPVLATVTAQLSGCEFISYTMPHQATIGLGGGDA